MTTEKTGSQNQEPKSTPPDFIQGELPLNPPNKVQWVVVKPQPPILWSSGKRKTKHINGKRLDRIHAILGSEQTFLITLGSLPQGWDKDKNGKKLRGAFRSSRLLKLIREEGWLKIEG